MTNKSPKTPPPPTLKQIAAALGYGIRRVSQLKKSGMPTDSLESALSWKRMQSGASDTTAERLRAERILLVAQQREKISLENRHRAGELILRSEVFESSFRNFSAARNSFLRMAAELPPQLCGESATSIQKKLRAEIIGILRALSEGLAKDEIADAENLKA